MSGTSRGSEQERRHASGPRLSRAALAATLVELRSLPNLFTAARLVLVVILWGFALAGNARVVGLGLALAFVTDAADGFAARRLNRVTPFGSRFDSLVDSVVGPSAIVWLLLLEPDVVRDHALLAGCGSPSRTPHSPSASCATDDLRISTYGRRGSRASLSTRSSSTSSSPAHTALCSCIWPRGSGSSSLETLVLQLAFHGIDEEERSISRALQRRRAVA